MAAPSWFPAVAGWWKNGQQIVTQGSFECLQEGKVGSAGRGAFWDCRLQSTDQPEFDIFSTIKYFEKNILCGQNSF